MKKIDDEYVKYDIMSERGPEGVYSLLVNGEISE